MYHGDVKFAMKEIEKLVGYKVTGVCADRGGESYGIVMEKGKDKKLCWIDCDPEGNGPGWLEIEDAYHAALE